MEDKVNITKEEVTPDENNLRKLIENDNIKKEEKVYLSNNQKYKKKEEIEYGKKSHMEYVKIINENKDPIGVKQKGGLRGITMEEVEEHNTQESMWTVLNGNVYDLTLYLDYHPGGLKKIMMGAGADCSALFGIIFI